MAVCPRSGGVPPAVPVSRARFGTCTNMVHRKCVCIRRSESEEPEHTWRVKEGSASADRPLYVYPYDASDTIDPCTRASQCAHVQCRLVSTASAELSDMSFSQPTKSIHTSSRSIGSTRGGSGDITCRRDVRQGAAGSAVGDCCCRRGVGVNRWDRGAGMRSRGTVRRDDRICLSNDCRLWQVLDTLLQRRAGR